MKIGSLVSPKFTQVFMAPYKGSWGYNLSELYPFGLGEIALLVNFNMFDNPRGQGVALILFGEKLYLLGLGQLKEI